MSDKLPQELLDQLVEKSRQSGIPQMICSVLHPEEPMSVNDILVSVWRKDGIVLRRGSALSALRTLRANGRVRKCGTDSFVVVGSRTNIGGSE